MLNREEKKSGGKGMKESNDLVARAKAGDFKKKSGAHQRVIAEEINSLKDDHRGYH